MDKDALDELERVAQAAGDAEWEVVDYEGGSLVIHADRENRVCFMATPGDSPGQMARIEARAVHIATFDPPTILTLIAAARPAVVSDEVVEAMARGFLEGLNEGRSLEFDALQPGDWAELRSAMRAALALLPGGVPDGWVLVPKEPTEAMVNAVWHHWLHGMGHSQECMRDALRAMLSASPKEVSPTQKDHHHER